MPFSDYRIYPGHNVSLNTLVNIETIKPTNDTRYFYAPVAEGYSDPGTPYINGAGYVSFNGFESVVWSFIIMTRLQLLYAKTTWCNGGWSGPVTIYSTNGGLTYARYNANMLISLPKEFDGSFFANKGVKFTMTRLVQL